ERAIGSLALAREAVQLPHAQKAATWRLGNAATGFALLAQEAGDPATERAWLAISYRVFSELASADEKFRPSLNHCVRRLNALGIEDPSLDDPVRPIQRSNADEVADPFDRGDPAN